MKKIVLWGFVIGCLGACAKTFVCYESKTIDKEKGKAQYYGCVLSDIKCEGDLKHFGGYPTFDMASKALKRCKKSNPRFSNDGRDLFEWNKALVVKRDGLSVFDDMNISKVSGYIHFYNIMILV